MACQIQELAEHILANYDKTSKVWRDVNVIVNPRTGKNQKAGINISSKSSDALGKALTNKTYENYQIKDVPGLIKPSANTQDGLSAEGWYKANQSLKTAPKLDMKKAIKYDMDLMQRIIVAKFKQYPELVQQITAKGGKEFIENSEHTVGVTGSRWEGKGLDSNFIKVLAEAYEDLVSGETSDNDTKVGLDDNNTTTLEEELTYLNSKKTIKGTLSQKGQKVDFQLADGDTATGVIHQMLDGTMLGYADGKITELASGKYVITYKGGSVKDKFTEAITKLKTVSGDNKTAVEQAIKEGTFNKDIPKSKVLKMAIDVRQDLDTYQEKQERTNGTIMSQVKHNDSEVADVAGLMRELGYDTKGQLERDVTANEILDNQIKILEDLKTKGTSNIPEVIDWIDTTMHKDPADRAGRGRKDAIKYGTGKYKYTGEEGQVAPTEAEQRLHLEMQIAEELLEVIEEKGNITSRIEKMLEQQKRAFKSLRFLGNTINKDSGLTNDEQLKKELEGTRYAKEPISTNENKYSLIQKIAEDIKVELGTDVVLQKHNGRIKEQANIKADIISKTIKQSTDARNMRIKKVAKNMWWKRYAAETKQVPGKYNDYYGAMEKAITKIMDPKVVTNVVGLMLEDVFNGKFQIVAGDYDPDTHTVQIAEKPRQMEIEMAVEEGLQEEAIRLYEDTTENMAYRAKLIEDYVNKNRANALAYVISSVESVNGGHTTTHELIHAGSVNFMRDPKNANHPAVLRVKELYKEALARESDIRTMTRIGDVYTEYWKKSEEEFISEALSNPQLMYALSNIKTVGKEKLSKGLFAELVESLIKMLGLSKKTEDNLLEFTMDGFAAIMEAQAVELSVPVDKELKEAVDNVRMKDENSIESTSMEQYQQALQKFIKDNISFKIEKQDWMAYQNIFKTAKDYDAAAFYVREINTVYLPDYDTLLKDFNDPKAYGTLGAKIRNDTGWDSEDLEFAIDKAKNELSQTHIKTHEYIHAAALIFMSKNPDHPATKRINKVFELVKDISTKDPKKFNHHNKYWSTSVDEFLAEALSNPGMIEELMNTKMDGSKTFTPLSSIFSKLLKSVINIFKLTKEEELNLHTYLMDSFIALVEVQQKQEVDIIQPSEVFTKNINRMLKC